MLLMSKKKKTTMTTMTTAQAPVEQANFGGNQLLMPGGERRSERVATKVQTTMNLFMLHKEIIKQYDDSKAKAKEGFKKSADKDEKEKHKKDNKKK